MLNYLLISSVCAASTIVCWAVVLLQQPDVIQLQCDMTLWLMYVPGSYLVNVANMWAYRLSIILHANLKRIKPFRHGKVFRFAVLLTCMTVLTITAATIVDPPGVTLASSDPNRPRNDIHSCTDNGIGTALIYTAILVHALGSVYCVISVRNGMEAFRDGMVIKEAFLMLGTCVFIMFVVHLIQLDYSTKYLLRVFFGNFGVLAFCMRLFFSRCARHWMVKDFRDTLTIFSRVYMLSTSEGIRFRINPDRGYVWRPYVQGPGQVSRTSLSLESPLYGQDIPATHQLREMMDALEDPTRCMLMKTVAKKEHLLDSLLFLIAVSKYERKAEELANLAGGRLEESCAEAREQLKEEAKLLFRAHVLSHGQLKVSRRVRNDLTKTFCESPLDEKLQFSIESAREKLLAEYKSRSQILFGEAHREVCIVLYQKLWTKFRSLEIEIMAGQNADDFALQIDISV